MIVMIALLNDGAILSIAYDNVRYSSKPEAWNMRRVLGVSTVLGVNGVIAAFLLFWLGERVFHLDRAHVQTLMYLKLSVAGHLTIFLTRTRGPFWTIKPAKILWIAVLGTQIVATLIAVYGLFMTPLGWTYAGLVWGYAILWALFTDRIKLLAYRVLDHVKADEAKPEAKADEPKPEGKADDAKPENKADQPKPENKADDAKPEDKVDGPKPEDKADQPKTEDKAEPKTEAKDDVAKPEAKDKEQSNVTPQLVKRVHELYEELGREDVQTVQDWEKANPATGKTKSQK
jgi:H+-transporting ATPase